MIDNRDIGKVLGKCSWYAPDKTPQVNEGVLMAWMEHFGVFPKVDLGDALEAVKVYYQSPKDRMVQPADISKIARDIRRDRIDRMDPDERPHREVPILEGAELDEVAERRRKAISKFANNYRDAL
jgi:hypothetical protein